MGTYLDRAEDGALGLQATPPPDELGEPCADCGSKDKWRWLDKRLLCRPCVIGDREVVQNSDNIDARKFTPSSVRARQWW
jgi:hypothetical protein